MAIARAILIPDGLADLPLEQLGGVTPMVYANTPNMDALARRGRVGLTHNVPPSMEPGSDVAIMSIMGYDPMTCYTGRGPLEALSMGVDIGPGELAFRLNLININGGNLIDYSAGHITTEESEELIRALQESLSSPAVQFHHGVSFRNVMILKGESDGLRTFAPHDHMDEPWEKYLPAGGPCQGALRELITRSREVLENHPVNKKRMSAGKRPANMMWPWSGGALPNMPPLEQKIALRGAAISAVDLVQGLGKAAGMEVIKVPGATGMPDTNYEGKAQAAIRALEEFGIVFVHVEATDETGHMGDVELKVKSAEYFDSRIVEPIMAALESAGDYRVLVTPDHPTPISIRTHTKDPVPFIAAGNITVSGGTDSYSEIAATATGLVVKHGHELLGLFASDNIFA